MLRRWRLELAPREDVTVVGHVDAQGFIKEARSAHHRTGTPPSAVSPCSASANSSRDRGTASEPRCMSRPSDTKIEGEGLTSSVFFF